jgi:hypothetical protein
MTLRAVFWLVAAFVISFFAVAVALVGCLPAFFSRRCGTE